MDNHELKKAGLKVTVPRLKILHILEHTDKRHLSAEEIYRQLVDAGEDVGLATVYRVLTQFEQAGLVIRHNFETDHSIFELDQGEHHDHLVCIKCGHVEEFMDSTIERHQEMVAQKHGYQIKDHSLIIYGTCGSCH